MHTPQIVIGGYYTEAVECLEGCPRVVKGVIGTENAYVRDFPRFLLHVLHDPLESYQEGASTANQRTEYWRHFLRTKCMELEKIIH